MYISPMYFFLLFLLVLSVSGLPPLRKHHSHLSSGVDEADVIQPTHHNTTLLFSTDASICGVASLSCMAFSSSSSSIPVRCGILHKAPVCERYDSDTKKSKCDTFCDTDGSGRLCEKAFPDCCRDSTNGCTSSQPRDITFYH